MNATYSSDWTPDPAPERSGIGAALDARGGGQQSLRQRLPSMVLSIGGHAAIAALALHLSMTAIRHVEEARTITVSIAAAEEARPEPPLPELQRMPEMPATMPQIAPPQLEIAAAPAPLAIQAAPPSPPQPPQDKPAEDAPVSPPRFDAAYLNNPATVYPNMSRRLREVGTVQLRVRVSAGGLPLEIQLVKTSGYARLDEAAQAAVRKWKFQAAMRSGSAIEAWVLVPVEFSLTR